MIIEYIFYLSLIVATLTVLIVAIKGFFELMAPIKAERAKKLQQEQEKKNGGS